MAQHLDLLRPLGAIHGVEIVFPTGMTAKLGDSRAQFIDDPHQRVDGDALRPRLTGAGLSVEVAAVVDTGSESSCWHPKRLCDFKQDAAHRLLKMNVLVGPSPKTAPSRWAERHLAY
jgi:hypothetical protein